MYSEKFMCILWYISFQQAVHEVKIVKIHMKTSEPDSLFHKFAGPQTAVLLKNILRLRCFPVNFHQFLKNVFHRTPLGEVLFQVLLSVGQ